MHRIDAVGNSPGVYRELIVGIRSFLGRLSGVAEKLARRLTMTGAMELQPDDGPRSSLRIESGFGRCNGISPKFGRRFAKGIRKLAGNTLGDYRKKTG
ncbi:hypothetical protein BHE74_00052012 [Ensete ventricosum]|nr:hypothetical protein BHE74_00052012 [Ensete ventricosum]